jgi:phage gp46-like protein
MKLDIEALAREAGISIIWGADDDHQAKQYYEGWPEQVEVFARLIVERCAVESESWWGADGRFIGSKLRQLLEDK